MKIKLDLDEEYVESEILIKTSEMTREVREIIDFLKKKNLGEHLTGVKDERFTIIKSNDIIAVYAQKGKVFAETENDIFEVKLKLYEVEERLSHSCFIRISKSEIINIDKIKYFESDFAGALIIVMKNRRTSYVSRRYKKVLKKGWVSSMKKKKMFLSIIRVFTGAFAMIGIDYLVALGFSESFGGFWPAPPAVVERVGVLQAAKMLAFYAGLSGAVFGGTKFLWEIDGWSILKSSAAYFGINLAVMSFCGYRMYWFPHSVSSYAVFVLIFSVIFVSIWCGYYFAAKRDAAKMNSKLKELRKN